MEEEPALSSSVIPTLSNTSQKDNNIEGSLEEKNTDHPDENSKENRVSIKEQHTEEELAVDTKNVNGDEENVDFKLTGDNEEVLEATEAEGKGEKDEEQIKEENKPEEEPIVEEDVFIEEPPPDPTAPFDFSDSKEALKEPFELRPDQLAEVEQLWDVYQNYTPAYTDIDGYITEKELVYMLKSLLLMTYTPEQLEELIAYCVRPPHAEGHITFEQFLKMVTIRQRDFEIEDELRSSLQVFDPGRTGTIDREYFREVLAKQGHKMPQKQLDNLIKEVDMSNDGTIGIEDVVGTMCIDLNKEDLMMLRASVYPPDEPPVEENF